MRRKIILLLAALIVCSLIYPLRYFYKYKTIYSVPDHATYEQAYGKMVDQVVLNAEEKNCWGYVRSLEKISAPDASLDFLVSDLNIALTQYKKWDLIVDKGTKAQMRERFDEKLEEWGALMDPAELLGFLDQQVRVVRNTRYSVQASWDYDIRSEGKFVKLNMTVNFEKDGTRAFDAVASFVYPDTLKIWEKQKSRVDISLIFLAIFVVLLGMLFLFDVLMSSYKAYKTQSLKRFLLQEISKKELLVQEGHYVAAIELLEKYLKYFPEDTEVRAFYYRLLDFTNNDPKKAQLAYVETKKLQTRLQQYADNPQSVMLSDEEKKELVPLLGYNPDLKNTYNNLVALESSAQKAEIIKNSAQELIECIQNRKCDKATEHLDILESNGYEQDEIQKWREEIREKIYESKKLSNELHQAFSTGKISYGIKLLNKLKIKSLSVISPLTKRKLFLFIIGSNVSKLPA